VHEISGDLWNYLGKAIVAITTSGLVTREGKAVCGQGCARQAMDRFPWLAHHLGTLIAAHGNHVFDLGSGLVSFPVEETPYENPDPRLIERSARELKTLADLEGWQLIVVPRPGCGSGGLAWRDVQPLLAKHFDDRFHIIQLPAPSLAGSARQKNG